MKNFKDIVNEKSKDAQIRSMLTSFAENYPKDYDDLRQYYYKIADGMETFVRMLNFLEGQTGEFTADLKNAKAMNKAFDKITLGKYV